MAFKMLSKKYEILADFEASLISKRDEALKATKIRMNEEELTEWDKFQLENDRVTIEACDAILEDLYQLFLN